LDISTIQDKNHVVNAEFRSTHNRFYDDSATNGKGVYRQIIEEEFKSFMDYYNHNKNNWIKIISEVLIACISRILSRFLLIFYSLKILKYLIYILLLLEESPIDL